MGTALGATLQAQEGHVPYRGAEGEPREHGDPRHPSSAHAVGGHLACPRRGLGRAWPAETCAPEAGTLCCPCPPGSNGSNLCYRTQETTEGKK